MGLNKWVGWGLSTLALRFLNKSKGSSASSAEPAALSVTQTRIGSPVPVVLGTCLVKTPLIAYWGDFSSRAYTETYAAHAHFNAWPLVFALIADVLASPATGTSKDVDTHGDSGHGTSKDVMVTPLIKALFLWLLSWLINGRNLKTTIQKGFKYYLGFQEIVCWSHPNAHLKAVYMNEKKVWEGDEAAANHTNGSPFVISIDDENLFGGPDENGGFSGQLHVYFGGGNQMPDSWMTQQTLAGSVQAGLRGLTPAYRSYISVVVPTAYIGKTATIPTMWYEVEIVPDGLGLGNIGQDANPAEILYEIHRNDRWGLAEDADLLNRDSLLAMGETLKEEAVGLSIQLTAKTQGRPLVDGICDHIGAIRYLEQTTGKMVYRLIRNDYEEADVVSVTPSNCAEISFSRQDWSNTINEISVSYTDRSNLYEAGTLSDVDAANVEINQGTKTTKTYEYPYFTTAENALWAAKRELRQEGYPVATADLICNRRLSNLRLGDMLRLNWPAYGIEHMYMRVTAVDLGDFIEGKVKISAMEDVFSLEKTTYGFSGTSGWITQPLYPTGVQAFFVMEFPFEILRAEDAYIYAFAAQPDADTTQWSIWRKGEATGQDFVTTNTLSKWTPTGRLIYDYEEFGDPEDMKGFLISDSGGIKELKMVLSAESNMDMEAARRSGKLLVIGDELMAFSALTQLPNGNWQVSGVLRGTYDTTPQKHAAGEFVYFIQSGHYGNVTRGGPVCKKGKSVKEFYNVTTATINKKEKFNALKVREWTTVRRAERPNVQGNIRLHAHNLLSAYHAKKLAGDLKLEWSARNKKESLGCVSQCDVTDFWSGLPYTPPEGLVYLTDVYVNNTRINRFTQGAALRPASARIACMGDGWTDAVWSNAANLPIYKERPKVSDHWTSLAGAGLSLTLDNHGLYGETTSSMLARFDADIVASQPDLCTLLGGACDIYAGGAVSAILANFESMVHKCRQASIVPLLLSYPVSYADYQKAGQEIAALKELHEKLLELAEREKIAIVDLWETKLLVSGIQDATCYLSDGIHLSRKGHRIVADAVLAKLKPILSASNRLVYTWAQRCKDSLTLNAQTKIDLYCQTPQGLESYQKQSRTFLWTAPVIVNLLATEADGALYVQNADNGGQIVVQAGPYNGVLYVDYEDCPVVLLGRKRNAMQNGAFYNQKGEIFLPDGRAMFFHDKDTYDTVLLEPGFVLLLQFRDTRIQTSKAYLQWDGSEFKEVTVT